MLRELNLYQAKVFVGLAGLVLLFLSSLTLVLGVSPLITLTILLSFLIVLLAALGCSLHLREIERLEEAEAREKMREKVALQMALINEILVPTRARIQKCEQIIANHPGLMDGATKNMFTTQRLIEALDERLTALTRLNLESNDEELLKTYKASEMPLHVRTDQMTTLINADPVPDLEPHLWRDTVDMLLFQIEKRLQERKEILV